MRARCTASPYRNTPPTLRHISPHASRHPLLAMEYRCHGEPSLVMEGAENAEQSAHDPCSRPEAAGRFWQLLCAPLRPLRLASLSVLPRLPQTGVTGFGSGSFDRIQLNPRTTTRFSRASSNSE